MAVMRWIDEVATPSAVCCAAATRSPATPGNRFRPWQWMSCSFSARLRLPRSPCAMRSRRPPSRTQGGVLPPLRLRNRRGLCPRHPRPMPPPMMRTTRKKMRAERIARQIQPPQNVLVAWIFRAAKPTVLAASRRQLSANGADRCDSTRERRARSIRPPALVDARTRKERRSCEALARITPHQDMTAYGPVARSMPADQNARGMMDLLDATQNLLEPWPTKVSPRASGGPNSSKSKSLLPRTLEAPRLDQPLDGYHPALHPGVAAAG